MKGWTLYPEQIQCYPSRIQIVLSGSRGCSSHFIQLIYSISGQNTQKEAPPPLQKKIKIFDKPTTVGSRSTKTALGTCFPAPVSEKNVLKESSPAPIVLSEGICPSGWIPLKNTKKPRYLIVETLQTRQYWKFNCFFNLGKSRLKNFTTGWI